jgi:hypothetical protein
VWGNQLLHVSPPFPALDCTQMDRYFFFSLARVHQTHGRCQLRLDSTFKTGSRLISALDGLIAIRTSLYILSHITSIGCIASC